jgi:hypothetical protein
MTILLWENLRTISEYMHESGGKDRSKDSADRCLHFP